MLDSRLSAAALRHIPDALFVTVSGAHLYGFASPDSDYDLRGAHLAPLCELVGLFPPRETIEVDEVRDGSLGSRGGGSYCCCAVSKIMPRASPTTVQPSGVEVACPATIFTP